MKYDGLVDTIEEFRQELLPQRVFHHVAHLVFATTLLGDLLDRPVQLYVDLPGKPKSRFEGKLVFVDPEIDPVNNQMRIYAEIDNTKLQLRPGQSAMMVIPLEKSKD